MMTACGARSCVAASGRSARRVPVEVKGHETAG